MLRNGRIDKIIVPAAAVCAALLSVMTLQARERTKTMPGRDGERIELPRPVTESTTSVEEALLERRSVRDFQDDSITLSDVAQLLWAAQGITRQRRFRTAPSAGALYPLELYVLARKVKGLPAGIYRYRPGGHGLARIAEGDRTIDLCGAALGQSAVRKAAAVFVLSGVYERTTAKYGERGVRYVHMEAGHVAQNIYLQAVPLGLGTVVIGAFDDEGVKRVLKMAGGETPLYIMPIGKK